MVRVEDELEAVELQEALDFGAQDLLRELLDELGRENGLVGRGLVELHVDPLEMRLAVLGFEGLPKLRRGLVLGEAHLQQQQAGQQAVPFGDGALPGVAARLLSADDGLARGQAFGHVLEPHRQLLEREAVSLREPSREVAHRDRLDDLALELLFGDQVVDDHREDLAGGEVDAVLINDADAVAVAVQGDAEQRLLRPHARGELL